VTATPASRIVVVDGNPSLAAVLAELLADEPGFEVGGVATTAARAIELADECSADVFLVDERLEGSLSADVLPALRERCPSAAFLLWSHNELHTATSDVDAVLQRGMTFRELVRVIRRVLRAAGAQEGGDRAPARVVDLREQSGATRP
jgi:DNA-binding NarL/FixJ family response regulator